MVYHTLVFTTEFRTTKSNLTKSTIHTFLKSFFLQNSEKKNHVPLAKKMQGKSQTYVFHLELRTTESNLTKSVTQGFLFFRCFCQIFLFQFHIITFELTESNKGKAYHQSFLDLHVTITEEKVESQYK